MSSPLVSDDLTTAAQDLLQHWRKNGLHQPPDTAVILGSGLRGAADVAARHDGLVTPYHDIPGMPVPAVAGHAGRMVVGGRWLNNAILLQGRSHLYEGWTVKQATWPIRLLAALGIRRLIVTNAAGGIRSGIRPGDLMLIDGHLAMTDLSRHRDTSDSSPALRLGRTPWDESLLATAAAIETPLRVHQGCYAMMSGPNYETPAEIRMLQSLGADAVGMSTVPEALVACHHGLQVLGISCITNVAAGLGDQPLDHSEVSETAERIEDEFVAWLWQLLDRI